MHCVCCAVSLATWLPLCALHVQCSVWRGVVGHWALVHRCARSVCCVSSVLGHLAHVHRCSCLVCWVACAVSLATWLLVTGVYAFCALCAVSFANWRWFTAVPAPCFSLCVRCPWPLGSRSPMCRFRVLCVRCPWPLGSCLPVCTLGVLDCVCGVLGHLALVHRCACSVCCVVCAVALATWLLFTLHVPARCVVLRVRCPWPLGPCPTMCCVDGVLGHLAPVHRCARSVCCVYAIIGDSAPVDRCARSVCCVARAVNLASWLRFTSVTARCVVLCVLCPRPLGSRSPVCTLGVLYYVCGVLGPLALVQRCARVVCFVWCVAGCCAIVCLLWFLRALGMLARSTCFWCGVCSYGWLWLLDTWSCALVVAGGVHLWRALSARAATPCLVRSGRSQRAGGLSRCRGAFPYQKPVPLDLLARGKGHVQVGRERGSLCLPLAPATRGCCARSTSYPFGAPRWGYP